jgi:hypothetical protein
MLLIFGGVLVSFIVLLITEVACLVAETAYRPSTVIVLLTQKARQGLDHLGYLVVLVFDVFGVIKRLALWIRDRFFGWIPKEKIEQAWRDLTQSLRETWRIPLGLLEGAYRSIMDAVYPIVTSLFFLLNIIFGPPVVETLMRVSGVDAYWYPSSIVMRLGLTLHSAGVWFIQLFDIFQTIINVFTWLFGYFPKEIFIQSLSDYYNQTWIAIQAPILGIKEGSEGMFDWVRDLAGPASILVFISIVILFVFVYLLFNSTIDTIDKYAVPHAVNGVPVQQARRSQRLHSNSDSAAD